MDGKASCVGLGQEKSANLRASRGDGEAWRPRGARRLSAVVHGWILKTDAMFRAREQA
jgi:hypothetical protein